MCLASFVFVGVSNAPMAIDVQSLNIDIQPIDYSVVKYINLGQQLNYIKFILIMPLRTLNKNSSYLK